MCEDCTLDDSFWPENELTFNDGPPFNERCVRRIDRGRRAGHFLWQQPRELAGESMAIGERAEVPHLDLSGHQMVMVEELQGPLDFNAEVRLVVEFEELIHDICQYSR